MSTKTAANSSANPFGHETGPKRLSVKAVVPAPGPYLFATFGFFSAGVSVIRAAENADAALRSRGFQPDGQTALDKTGNRGGLRATFAWTQTSGGVQVHLSVVGLQSQLVVWEEYNQLVAKFLNPPPPPPPPPASQGNGDLEGVPKTPVGRGQKFVVTFRINAAQAQTAFVAITNSGSSTWRGRFNYQYTQGRLMGTMEFVTPSAPGVYRVKLYGAEHADESTPPIKDFALTVQ